ncbi:U6 snRNA-associated Sm-like protein LSm1 [Stylophora pistillata]|uniref:U6 snRNA-associated Sm-like protein LSm1 n=1 Tax=Stylophora pistillata TaxID=50429 RepID=A0A2B4STJ7_STYPI|nr:U6 snRNA-associated Sm-like protein LSm1 [Stylophora pistillata]PFX34004.1 U6 snRNA-associated Sm-like protein LSm1 [Stylophora pistillata]
MSFLPGTASLIKEIDKRLMVLLRDGRTLIGYLRSIDQFANLLLQDTIERIHVGGKYGDIPRGIFLIRGENMVLAGEIDEEKEAQSELEEVSVPDILELQRDEQLAKEEQERVKTKAKLKRGLPVNVSDTYLSHDDVFN